MKNDTIEETPVEKTKPIKPNAIQEARRLDLAARKFTPAGLNHEEDHELLMLHLANTAYLADLEMNSEIVEAEFTEKEAAQHAKLYVEITADVDEIE